jgi:hypothetical protein
VASWRNLISHSIIHPHAGLFFPALAFTDLAPVWFLSIVREF